MTAAVGLDDALELADSPLDAYELQKRQKRLMISLHSRLTAGHPASVALATSRERLNPCASGQAGFVCLGTG